MSDPETSFVELDGTQIRIWRKGRGPRIGFLAGFGGLPRWIPFLDRLAEARSVVVPSLPGFPGGGRGHARLDSQLDWVLATRRLLEAAGLHGADLVGSSVGGAGSRAWGTVGRGTGASGAGVTPAVRSVG